MIGFIIIGVVIAAAAALFPMLAAAFRNEGQGASEKDVVPITDLKELQRETKPKLTDTQRPAGNSMISSLSAKLKGAKNFLGQPEKEKSILDVPLPGSVKLPTPEKLPPEPVIPAEKAPAAADIQTPEKRIAELEQELKLVGDKAIEQAEESVKLIRALMKENEALKAEKAQAPAIDPGKLEESNKALTELQGKYEVAQNQLEVTGGQVKQLEEQVESLKKEMEKQSTEANAVIARLKNENESAEHSREESNQQAIAQKVQEALAAKTQDMSQQIADLKQAQQTLAAKKAELEAQLATIDEKNKKENEQLLALVEQQKAEAQTLEKGKAEAQAAAQQMKELNRQLMEKAQALQYELTKNRAQITGLEKMCENLKVQLETAHKAA